MFLFGAVRLAHSSTDSSVTSAEFFFYGEQEFLKQDTLISTVKMQHSACASEFGSFITSFCPLNDAFRRFRRNQLPADMLCRHTASHIVSQAREVPTARKHRACLRTHGQQRKQVTCGLHKREAIQADVLLH
jgi:hypothetical protein